MNPNPRKCLPLLAIMAVLFSVLQVRADYASIVNSYSPIAYWRLNETSPSPAPAIAANSSTLGAIGNGYVVLDVLQGQPGIVGNAARFNNSGHTTAYCGSKIDVPFSPLFNPNPPFSVEFWAMVPSIGGYDSTGECVLSSENPAGTGGSSRTGFLFYLSPSGVWQLRLGKASGYYLVLTAAGGNAVPGTWQHIAFTWDGATAKLYIDGALVASAASVGSGWTPNTQMALRLGGTSLNGGASLTGLPVGAYQAGPSAVVISGNRGFDGYLDEVALYGTSLSVASVAAHYAAATTNNAGYHAQILGDNPLLYLGLDEPAVTPPDPSTFPTLANSGTLGSAADATSLWGVVDGQPGAGYGGFGAGNAAVLFNGEAGNIAVNDTPGLHFNGTITMMAWIKPGVKDFIRDIIGHGGDNNSAETFLRINRDADYYLTSDDGYGDDGNFYEVGATDGVNGTFYDNAYFPIPPGDIGNWVFLAGTFDGVNWNLYRNGVLVSSAPASGGGALDVTNAWSLGSRSDPTASDGLFFGGSLDEPAIFTNALAAADIMAIYNAAQVSPVLTQGIQPPVGTVFAGSSLTFSIYAEGSPTLAYAWLSNGVPTGVTATTITLNNLQVGSDTIAVVVSNPYGKVTNAVTFAVVAAPPFFVQEPAPVTRFVGYPYTLSVVAGGSAPIAYQWLSNSVVIAGATAPTYSGVASPVGSANFSCTLSNQAGVTNSGPVAVTAVAIPSNYPAAVIAAGPIAYYRLDEASGTVAHDLVGGNDGTYNMVTLGLPGYSGFDPDTAAGFTGLNSYVGNINGAAINFQGHTNFTLEVWVKGVPGQADESTIISKGHGSSGTTPDEQFSLDVFGGKYRIFTRETSTATINNSAVASEGPNGTWQHVVGVYDDSNEAISIFVNGVLEGNGTPNLAGLRATAEPVTIGAKHLGNSPDYDGAFVGTIDEVAVYSVALDATTIAAHYSAIYGPSTKPFFTLEPVSVTNYAGLPVVFSASASGTVPITYQWYKNGSPIPSATDPSYTNSAVAVGDAGSYTVLASNTPGSSNSFPAVLTVLTAPTNPPVISDLVLHITFNNSLTDVTGRGNDGSHVVITDPGSGRSTNYTTPASFVPIGGPGVPNGPTGQAYSYSTDPGWYPRTASTDNNTNYDFVTLGVRPDLQFSSNVDFTISYWIQLPANYTSGDLPFLCTAAGSTFGPGIVLAPSYGPDGTAGTGNFPGGWALSAFNAANSGAGVGYYGPIGSINDGGWHHLLHVFQRSANVTTYLDGVPSVGSLQGGTALSAAGDIDTGLPMNVGQDPTGIYGEAASATIADLAIWRKALSQLEAASVFIAGATNSLSVGTPPAGPVSIAFQVLPGNQLKLTWPNGTLQSATTVTGPYTSLPAAASPYIVPLTGSKMFFRVKL